MDHQAPDTMKSYWNIRPGVAGIEKNGREPGLVGVGFGGRAEYEPPHSRGPGPKTDVITTFALSGLLEINQPAGEVRPEVLLEGVKDKNFDRASLHVAYE